MYNFCLNRNNNMLFTLPVVEHHKEYFQLILSKIVFENWLNYGELKQKQTTQFGVLENVFFGFSLKNAKTTTFLSRLENKNSNLF